MPCKKTPQKYVMLTCKKKTKRKNANGVFKEEETSFFSLAFYRHFFCHSFLRFVTHFLIPD